MMDLQRSRAALAQGGYTCVLCHGEALLADSRRGVKPLLELLERKKDFTGYCAADKVVGKAPFGISISTRMPTRPLSAPSANCKIRKNAPRRSFCGAYAM